ncbi:MAG: hypothetical protein WCX73_04080 [Candidatus Pacearchaeota archaeon]|jgi:Tfp pilus assembly protein PilO
MRYGDILISSVIGLIVNLFSVYLLTLGKININSLIVILTGSIVLIIIIGFQSKINEVIEGVENQRIEQIKLKEKLKIYEQLIGMKGDIKELQKRCKL